MSVGSRVGKETLEILQALYPKTRYYSTFPNNFNGLFCNLALEKRINPKFDFQLGRLGVQFECVINGTPFCLDWTNLSFETLISKIYLKPKLNLVRPKLSLTFHDMLLSLQANSKGNGRLISERTKI